MSGRTSRRSQQAALGADAARSAPAAEVRTRKWTKQLRSVGHLTLWKWVPDQEAPTEALQKGAFKKTKGRKRQQAFEVGRMTRSVRQHLDAPLELLNEYPVLRHSSRHSSTTTSPAPHTASTAHATKKPPEGPPEASQAPTPSPPAELVAAAIPSAAAASSTEGAASSSQTTAAAPPLDAASPAEPSAMPLIPLPSDVTGSMLSAMVSSDEQLEMALDDLPMLDADEDLFNAPFMSAPLPIVPSAPAQSSAAAPEPASNANSASNSASQSGQDEGNNTADDSNESGSDDDGSANSASASPMPSPSPATSPMPSHSPSP